MGKHDQSDDWYGLEMPAEGTREYRKLEHRGGFDVPAWNGHRPTGDPMDGWTSEAIQHERALTIQTRAALIDLRPTGRRRGE